MGLAHRDSILKTIASEFEHWNHLVSLYCLSQHLISSIQELEFRVLWLLL